MWMQIKSRKLSIKITPLACTVNLHDKFDDNFFFFYYFLLFLFIIYSEHVAILCIVVHSWTTVRRNNSANVMSSFWITQLKSSQSTKRACELFLMACMPNFHENIMQQIKWVPGRCDYTQWHAALNNLLLKLQNLIWLSIRHSLTLRCCYALQIKVIETECIFLVLKQLE